MCAIVQLPERLLRATPNILSQLCQATSHHRKDFEDNILLQIEPYLERVSEGLSVSVVQCNNAVPVRAHSTAALLVELLGTKL